MLSSMLGCHNEGLPIFIQAMPCTVPCQGACLSSLHAGNHPRFKIYLVPHAIGLSGRWWQTSMPTQMCTVSSCSCHSPSILMLTG